jgi:pyruvate/2-oxoglutarate dehydrogenase complex dihydrolipoamide acyltransferase (E2) component
MAEMITDAAGERKPIPDPTALTTEQLMREINRLEESVKLRAESGRAELQGQISLTNERFEALRRSLDERFATQQFAITTAFDAAQGAKADAKELFDSKLITLRELLNERYTSQTEAVKAAFDAAEKSVNQQMTASKEAVEKANTANEARFQSVNEFRGQLNDLVRTFVPRAEIDAMMSGFATQIGDLKEAVDKGLTGVNVRHDTTDDQRETSRANLGIVIAAGSMFLTLVFILVTAMHIGGH